MVNYEHSLNTEVSEYKRCIRVFDLNTDFDKVEEILNKNLQNPPLTDNIKIEKQFSLKDGTFYACVEWNEYTYQKTSPFIRS